MGEQIKLARIDGFGDVARIEPRTVLKAPTADVWAATSEIERVEQWWAGGILEGVELGRIVLGNLTILVCRPPHALEFTWNHFSARESYAAAIELGEWSGFSCSMTQFSHRDFVEKLDASSHAASRAIENVAQWTVAREELLMTLAEHETMHEGQLIRHIYSMGRSLPASWKWA